MRSKREAAVPAAFPRNYGPKTTVSVTFVGLYLIVKCSPELMLSPLTVANVPLTVERHWTTGGVDKGKT